MNQFDWGNRKEGKIVKTYKIALVTGAVIYMASPLSLEEVKLQFLGRYSAHGLAINITEVPDALEAPKT